MARDWWPEKIPRARAIAALDLARIEVEGLERQVARLTRERDEATTFFEQVRATIAEKLGYPEDSAFRTANRERVLQEVRGALADRKHFETQRDEALIEVSKLVDDEKNERIVRLTRERDEAISDCSDGTCGACGRCCFVQKYRADAAEARADSYEDSYGRALADHGRDMKLWNERHIADIARADAAEARAEALATLARRLVREWMPDMDCDVEPMREAEAEAALDAAVRAQLGGGR